ncbi:hypothetical protein ACJJTC_015785 [Scirpophaga incertulas]
MAYDTSRRFPSKQKYFKLLDPGAYSNMNYAFIKANKVPFLSRAPRKTAALGRTIWTHTIYDAHYKQKILNCTSFKSKCPRFPYNANKKQENHLLICNCDSQNKCLCGTEEVPIKGIDKRVKGDDPPLYNACVNESTAYYRGWKWSKWSSKRSSDIIDNFGPGPADYFYIKQPTDFEICANKLKEFKRRTSKQPRYIEMVQMREITNDLPGPANYFPRTNTGYVTQFTGSKAQRFKKSSSEQLPGPSDYCVKRTFDLPHPSIVYTRAKLPKPSFFGVKAIRFKEIRDEGPSPATYNILCKPNISYCHSAPFNSSSKRFNEAKMMVMTTKNWNHK